MFVSHDAPSFALEPGELGLRLRACVPACLRACVSACLRVCGPSLDGLRALLVISPHWQTHNPRVSSAVELAVLSREVRFGMLSMESYSWGLDQGQGNRLR
jgi:4,5-DOPA dioxygenase extradiol